MERLEKFFQAGSGKSILDIATGRGEFIGYLKHFYPEFETIIGVDQDERMLNMAREQFADDNRISFVQQDAYNLQFKENKFDLITISNSLHHFDDNERLIQSVKPWLTDNGKILISEIISDDLSESQLSHKLVHHFSAKIDRLHGKYHAETLSQKEILELVVKLGLKICDKYLYTSEIEDKQADDVVTRMETMIPRMLQAAEEFSEYEELQKESVEIINWLRNYKFASASTLFIWAEIAE